MTDKYLIVDIPVSKEVSDAFMDYVNKAIELEACIQDARSLMIDYDGHKTAEGLKTLINKVDMLLMTHKPLERISSEKAGE